MIVKLLNIVKNNIKKLNKINIKIDNKELKIKNK